MGRPSDYTPEIAATICGLLAEGRSLRKICGQEGMPSQSMVYRWLADLKEFREQYVHAREVQADTLADEILDISDDGRNDTYVDENGNVRTDQDVIARSRLRVDARKWLASKMAPKKYGEKVTQEHTGLDGGPIETKSTLDTSKLTVEQLRVLSSISILGS